MKIFKLTCNTLLLLLASGLVQAKDLALKFEGTPTANNLSNSSQQAIDEFVDMGLDFNQNDFACFEAPLFDLSTGREIGVGVDCLNPVTEEISSDSLPAGSVGVMIDATTFFLLPGGNLVSQGRTTVQPFFPGTGNAMGAVTHLSGSIPNGLMPANVYGTGKYSSWGGTKVRLSGAVNLGLPDDQIFFSCLFIIERP